MFPVNWSQAEDSATSIKFSSLDLAPCKITVSNLVSPFQHGVTDNHDKVKEVVVNSDNLFAILNGLPL